MRSFLYQQCKDTSIEQTRDTMVTGKYLLVVRNNDITQAKTKLGKVFRKLQQSSPTLTIKASLSKFMAYLEIVDGIRSNLTLLSRASHIKLLLDQAPTQTPIVQTQTTQRRRYQFYKLSAHTTTTDTTTPKQTTYAEITNMNRSQPTPSPSLPPSPTPTQPSVSPVDTAM